MSTPAFPCREEEPEPPTNREARRAASRAVRSGAASIGLGIASLLLGTVGMALRRLDPLGDAGRGLWSLAEEARRRSDVRAREFDRARRVLDRWDEEEA